MYMYTYTQERNCGKKTEEQKFKDDLLWNSSHLKEASLFHYCKFSFALFTIIFELYLRVSGN